MTDKGRHLDISSPEGAERDSPKAAGTGSFLGVHFECCDVYLRIYPNREQTAYVGHCPRCGRKVQFLIGEGGTSERFFRAR